MATERVKAGVPSIAAPMQTAIFLLLLLSASHAQVTTNGGNVTQLALSQNNLTDKWDGLYGQVVLGTGTSFSYVVSGGNITRVNFIGQEPPCIVASQSLRIIAVNATSITAPLQPGNLSVLDALLGAAGNASAAFIQNGSFELSYGNFSGVPALFTLPGNATSGDFREGYLNDALGNLVFVADVVGNMPDWNGTASDYQIMLPLAGANYTLFVDVAYSCAPTPPPPPPGGNTHRLYIPPPGPFTVPSGSTFDAAFIVRDTGDFAENNIGVTLNCPTGFSCGFGTIPHLPVGGQQNASLPITADGAGEFVLTVCARNADTFTCRDFIVRVTPECSISEDCGTGGFCQGNTCEEKKKPGEWCNDSEQCLNNVCTGGLCSLCSADSDCADDQSCAGGACVKIRCPCGRIAGHACISYACCADTDCGACQMCSGNSCRSMKFDILIAAGAQEGLIEGQPVRVQVLGNNGQGVPGARVFTSEMEAHTDANGYATITVPYDGIIYASSDCYANAGVMFTIVRKGSFETPNQTFVGEDTWMRLVDSRGLPIAGATVFVDGTGLTTDSNGAFHHIFDFPGRKTMSARITGYDIPDAGLDVAQRFSCGYPVVLGLLSFDNGNIWLLWLISIVLAIFNFLLLRRRMRRTARKWPVTSVVLQLAYALVPLLIAAIPGTWFGICFMSNVVTLQLIVELLLLAWNVLRGEGGGRERGADRGNDGGGKETEMGMKTKRKRDRFNETKNE